MKHLNELVRSADIGAGAVVSGCVASGEIGYSTHLFGDGGFVSGAGDSLVATHGLGAVPPRENVILTPRANAIFWVTAVNASQISISTSVSGTGTDWKAFI